jgi:hypothetical protein
MDETKQKEYFMWANDLNTNIYICLGKGKTPRQYLWKLVYSFRNPTHQGREYEALAPKEYKDCGVTILNKTQVALIILQGKNEK